MKADFEFKDKYNFNDLVEIIKILRAPGAVRGTPSKLTPQSARIFLRKPTRRLKLSTQAIKSF